MTNMIAEREELLARDELSLEFDDLQVEEIMPVELNEEAQASPENLASSVFNTTAVSSMVMAE